MSLDRRLREELRRDADRIVPDVERNLGAVQAQVRRQPAIGWPALLAATAVIALVVWIRLGVNPGPEAGGSQNPGSTGIVTPTAGATAAPSFDAIAGTYTVSLDAANAAIAQNGIAGTWTMRLIADGEIFLSPPASFGSGTGSLSGLAFTITADRFRSNIFYNDFCNSIGTYTWALAGGSLSFTPVDDACSIRRALLSTTPWRTGP